MNPQHHVKLAQEQLIAVSQSDRASALFCALRSPNTRQSGTISSVQSAYYWMQITDRNWFILAGWTAVLDGKARRRWRSADMHAARRNLRSSHDMWWWDDEEDDDGPGRQRPKTHQSSCAGQEDHNEAWQSGENNAHDATISNSTMFRWDSSIHSFIHSLERPFSVNLSYGIFRKKTFTIITCVFKWLIAL